MVTNKARRFERPQAGEYIPYTSAYINLVPDDGLVLQHLENNLRELKELVAGADEHKLRTPCAEGEWTIKEIIGHISDAERVFAYRALRIARHDTTPLPGFEQDDYVASAGANQRTIEDLLEELTTVRQATLTLFRSFDEEVCKRSGLVNDHPTSVRANLYIIAGHELHHLASLKEHYF